MYTEYTIGSGSTYYYCSVFNSRSQYSNGTRDPITTLTIGENVTSIPSYAFHDCRNITGSLSIPSSVTSIGSKAFYYCDGITKIHANSETPPTVGTQAFYGVNHSIPVFVPCGTRPLYIAASGWSDFTNYPLSPSDLVVKVNSEYFGEATVTLMGTCDNNESTVHAEPYPGCVFTNWTVEGEVVSTEADYSFNLTEDITLTANFELIPNHHLFVGTNSNLWNRSANWLPQELPTENSTVVLHANVTVNTTVNVANVYFFGNSRLTINSVGFLSVTDEIVPSETSSIGILDGGQLFHTVDGIEASIYKTITPYTEGERDGWFLISNPLANDVDISEVQNLADNINFDNYDFYYYDEPSCYWMNQKDNANGFTEMEIGKGYLYGNNCIGLISTNKEYNFESGAPGWTIIDADGDGNVWYPIIDNTSNNNNGVYISQSYDYYNSHQLFPDNYFVSPQMNFGLVSSITLWARALDANNPAEHFGVAVSVNGNTETTDFTTIQEWTLNDANWHRYTINLDQFSGQKGYVAIRHFNCHGQSALLVDDVVFEDIIVSFPWNSMSIAFSGELQNGTAEVNVPLSYTPNTPLPGFNLVGNPFVCNAYLLDENNDAMPFFKMNDVGNAIVAVRAGTPIKPCEGVFVLCPNDRQAHSVIFTTTTPANIGEAQNVPPVSLPLHDLFVNQDAFLANGITQTIALSAGWNWWSTYIEANNPVTLLDMLKEGLGNNAMQIQAAENMTEYDGEDWFGDLDDLGISNEQTYLIEMGAPCTVALQGMPANPANHVITINHGWNWIGFPSAEPMDVVEAFAGFEAEEEDQIMSQNGMTEFDGEEWFGDLETLEPGQGLMYFSNSTETKTIIFQTIRKQ